MTNDTQEQGAMSLVRGVSVQGSEGCESALKEGMLCPTHDYSNSVRVYAPDAFTESQQLVWYELLQLFVDAGVITQADLPALTLAAMGYESALDSAQERPLRINSLRVVFNFFVRFGCVPSERKVKRGASDDAGQFDILSYIEKGSE